MKNDWINELEHCYFGEMLDYQSVCVLINDMTHYYTERIDARQKKIDELTDAMLNIADRADEALQSM